MGEKPNKEQRCFCDVDCAVFADCCPDYEEQCLGCDEEACRSDQDCVNTDDGVYACGCPEGFVDNGVDACVEDGVNGCMCPEGYRKDGLGGCADIDECAEGLDDCDPLLTCFNLDGDFECRYPVSCLEILNSGYSQGDGVYTIDWDGEGETDVFCNMTNDGGGWTRVVNIRGDSIFHGDEPDAVGDVSDDADAAKLSDAAINGLSTVGYFRYNCGPSYNVFVWNEEHIWTSARTNNYNWHIDRGRDGVFECSANRAGYVFSEYPSCPDGHTDYVATSAVEGLGCYVGSWGQNGNLWAK